MKNCRVHPSHWLISTQVRTARPETIRGFYERHYTADALAVIVCVEIKLYVVSSSTPSTRRLLDGVASTRHTG